jgi:hypothetical protein
MKRVVILSLALVGGSIAGEVQSINVVPAPITEAEQKTALVTPPWSSGSVFTVQAVLPEAFPPGTKDTAGRGPVVDQPMPVVIAGARIYAGSSSPICGFPGPEGFIDRQVATWDDLSSTWHLLRSDLAPGASRHWSWDGSTCFAWLSDKTIRRANGEIVWRLPAEIEKSVSAGASVPVWSRSGVPRNATIAKFIPGAVANDRIGLIEMTTTESVAGAITNTLSWLIVSQSGVQRCAMATAPTLPTEVDAFALHTDMVDSARWACVATGAAKVEIERDGRDGPGKVTLRTMLPDGAKLARKDRALGKGYTASVQRYRDGFLVLVGVRLEQGELQVVGIAGENYLFRQQTNRCTRAFVIDEHGAVAASWLLPGVWEPVQQRMRGDVVALLGQASNAPAPTILTALFDPVTGRIAPKAYVGAPGRPVLDAVWQDDRVAFMTIVPALGRACWVGDAQVVQVPTAAISIQASTQAAPPSVQRTADGATALAVAGRWQIVEGPGIGQFVEFAADGGWTSPWGDFGGRWSVAGTTLTMTANRQVQATVLEDGRIRVQANVTFTIQKTK